MLKYASLQMSENLELYIVTMKIDILWRSSSECRFKMREFWFSEFEGFDLLLLDCLKLLENNITGYQNPLFISRK